jgi:3-oxoacyl-[acyl-carrier-protein] synthase-3
MSRPIGAAVAGTGSCLPPRVVPNAEFTQALDTTDDWIRSRTGIRERRFAGRGETAATLGTAAARAALAAATLTPGDVDLIVCGTVTPDLVCPSNACLIQSALGCRPVPAFDVSAACSGFLYALGVAEKFVRTGSARHALVVGSEVLSRVLDPADRNTCIIFGDGAGAVVLSAAETPGVGVRRVHLYADGSRGELIQVPSTVTPDPPPLPNPACPADTSVPKFVRMNGREVFKFAVYRMIELLEQADRDCRDLGIPAIDLLVPHQVNQRIIDAALEATGFPTGKVMVNLNKYGNTSAASVPIALDEALRGGRAKRGDTVLLVAFGGGLTWSSALVTL